MTLELVTFRAAGQLAALGADAEGPELRPAPGGGVGVRLVRAGVEVRLAVSAPAFAGGPAVLVVEVDGDSSGTAVALEAADEAGVGVVYRLGAIAFKGPGRLEADAALPSEFWGSAGGRAPWRYRSLRVLRICLRPPPGGGFADLVIHRLCVEGSVTTVANGLAGSA